MARGQKPGAERPMFPEEVRQIERVEARGKAPKSLEWPDLSAMPRIELHGHDRGERDRRTDGDETAETDGYRPDWVGATRKPARDLSLVPPALRLRGHPVEAMRVIGTDDRRAYFDRNYPWGCVCRVSTNRGQGSGIIVGPRHVLTASHVIDWRFGPHRVDVHASNAFVSATTWCTYVHAWTRVEGLDYFNVDEDYAVLVTEQRIGDWFGWLGTRTYDSGWDDDPYWHSVGYAGGVQNMAVPIYQGGKWLDEDPLDYGGGRAMMTDADLTPGQSGSAMFGFWSNGPYVVAVASGEGDMPIYGRQNWCSGGSDLTRLVRRARQVHA